MLMMFFGIDAEDAEPGAYGHRRVRRVRRRLVAGEAARCRASGSPRSVCQAVWHLLEGTARANGVQVAYDEPLPAALTGAALTPGGSA